MAEVLRQAELRDHVVIAQLPAEQVVLDGWFLDASGHLAGCFNYQQFLVDECTRNLEIEPRSALAKIPKSRSFVIAIRKLSWLREECQQNGRASCRERVCQYGEIPVVALQYK